MSDNFDEFIFGVRTNGISFSLAKLSIEDDQSVYDYICNVASKYCQNGNGAFSITILNKNLTKGIPVGKWTLVEGLISYDWCKSSAKFVLSDERGFRTKWICSADDFGSSRGFNKETLVRSIFTKAREIVLEFPNANIYDAYSEFMDNTRNPSKDSLLRFEKYSDDSIRLIDSFKYNTITPLSDYLERFEKVVSILQKDDDVRCKELLNKVVNSCRTTIGYIIDK